MADNGLLATPVAFFVFNRPDMTARVFEKIREARPARLLIVADGARAARGEEERQLVAKVRGIIDGIDWPCEASRDFSEENLGCKRRMSSGLDWVFSQVEEAIILEDDCVPDPTFFPFCSELLSRYRDDDRVMIVGGSNFQFGQPRAGGDSYYFSTITHIWGWATWRRAWQHYDVMMRDWPAVRAAPLIDDFLQDERTASAFRKIFDDVHGGKVDTWDSQWTFAVWRRAGLTILPDVNLITNIGFGSTATHTRSTRDPHAGMPTQPIAFPLRHPAEVRINREADAASWARMLGSGNV